MDSKIALKGQPALQALTCKRAWAIISFRKKYSPGIDAQITAMGRYYVNKNIAIGIIRWLERVISRNFPSAAVTKILSLDLIVKNS
ncbi:MAG: hypothetical protein ACTS85_02985 [Arsenophonus sp. NC-PG7-MAG3]